MAVEVFKEPYCRRHYARRLSLAFIARILGIVGSMVLAFVVAYSTGDFWQRTGTWQEQPRVSFTNDMILVLQGPTAGDERLWSSYPTLNAALGSRLLIADVGVTQRDLNYDGKTDVVDVEVTARGMSDIRGVQAVLQFEYVLRSKVHLRMTGLAYVQHAAGTPGGAMTADGQLRFRQQNPLKDSGTRTQYDTAALSDPANGTDALTASAAVSLDAILATYLDRNETTILDQPYITWTSGDSSAFKLTIRVRVPPNETYVYRPHIFQMLKFGWIQWLCTFAIIFILWRKLEITLFTYRMVETRVISDIERKEHRF